MSKFNWSWGILLTVSVVFVAGFCAQSLQIAAALDSGQPEGRIVEIAPAVGEPARIEEPIIVEEPAERSEPPAFWIGIRGRHVTEPVLRTQFQLAADMGIVTEEVVKESPAAKAGLRQHDILLRANGEPILSMQELSRMVASGDAKPIELRLIRLGKEETIVVVPEQRPAGMERSEGGNVGGGFGFGLDEADPLGALRMFRGGMDLIPQGGAMAFNNIAPNGYSVSIARENGQPTKITVKKGDKTWTIEGDDKAALAELPDDVRAHVEGLLNGNGNLDMFRNQMRQFQLRGWPGGNFNVPQGIPFNDQQDQIFKKMEEMERQLKQLQKQLDQE